MPASSLVLHLQMMKQYRIPCKRRTQESCGSFRTNRTCYFVGRYVFEVLASTKSYPQVLYKCGLGTATTERATTSVSIVRGTILAALSDSISSVQNHSRVRFLLCIGA